MSFRSLPSSAKRTVTSPPVSMRTTTPSPSVEWRTESPPPKHNFHEQLDFTVGPYDYDKPLEAVDVEVQP